MISSLPTGRLGQGFAVGLLAIALAIAWVAVASPALGWYESRAENVNEQVMIARRMHVIAAELPQLQRQAKVFNQSDQTQDAFIAGATDAIAGAALEQTLQTMASQGGATLSSGEILAPQADGPYTRIQLRVSVSGSWPVLMQLLAAIGANRPVLLVDDLQISGSQDLSQPDDTAMDAGFTVIAFRAGTVHPISNEADSSSPIKP